LYPENINALRCREQPNQDDEELRSDPGDILLWYSVRTRPPGSVTRIKDFSKIDDGENTSGILLLT